MLQITVRHGTQHCDGLTRRELLRVGALGLGGLHLPGLLQLQIAAVAIPSRTEPGNVQNKSAP